MICVARADAPGRWTEPVTGMAFVEIPAGSFTMGSPDDEPGREAQERQHAVTIARSFWLGAYEVTQAQWRRVMGTSPSRFTSPRRFPSGRAGHLVRRSRVPGPAHITIAGPHVPSAHRGGVGVRVPRRDDDGLQRRRHIDASGREHCAVTRHTGGGARPHRERRIVPTERVGPLRHARQRVGVDRGRSLPVFRRSGDRSRRHVRGAAESDSRRQLVFRGRQRALRASLYT